MNPSFCSSLARAAAAWLMVGMAFPAWALHLQLDYSYDTKSFFRDNDGAQAALEAAAHDIESLLATSPAAVEQHLFSASDSQQTVSLNWSFSFPQPSSGQETKVTPYDAAHPLAADTITLYVGARALAGDQLGQSVPLQPKVGYLVTPSGAPHSALVQQVKAESQVIMTRGDGPIMGSLSGYIGTQPYVLPYGLFGGSLWFDYDTDDDNVVDSPTVASRYWHFDPSTQPLPGERDFYTVALQQILHSMGFGFAPGELGEAQTDGNDWLGPEVAALYGSGEGLLLDGQVNPYLTSTTLGSGEAQAALMAGRLGLGERRFLTALDAAFLRDLGYRTVPEPGAAALLVATLGLIAGWRWRRVGS